VIERLSLAVQNVLLQRVSMVLFAGCKYARPRISNLLLVIISSMQRFFEITQRQPLVDM
jgi:hypothetical protein